MVAVEIVAYVILYVRELEASAAFYRDVVGLPVALDLPERNAAFMWIGERGRSMLGLWGIGSAVNSMTLHIAFDVALDDVLAAPERLRAVVITHLHPDHSYGLPMLLMGLWLLGRRESLAVHAPDNVTSRLRRIMESFEWADWPHFFGVDFLPIADRPGAFVLETDDFRITASRNQHMVPTVALRIENRSTGYVVAYSSDTAPCDAVVDLARNADLLLHEAAGSTLGHSNAAMAGQVAGQAGAKKLVLVHYPVDADPIELAEEAQATFAGSVEVAQDLAEYPA